ncbi:DUF1467 family protein [Limoniibacter endophyticus]|uniref:Membrane protein n=1 Tax=Limoniibacter endophyticus TaxID=1565040 RepID=A0A8J3GFU4_9HYPH|nr:DUF1467 family protein [Limoniibacter endophyticus]GHC60446.1 membrane protein [Limoniibacter endophyticus]
MTIFSAVAVYFVIWWTVLFASIPFGLRTQEEEGSVIPGTTASAPAGSHMRRVVIRNSIVAALIYGALYGGNYWLGWSLDDLPRIIPDFPD